MVEYKQGNYVEVIIMNKKKVRNVIITGIATIAGVFGGFKVYSNKKKKYPSIAAEKKETNDNIDS